jgi:hypothetical protein
MKKQTMYNRLQKQYEKLNQSIQKAMKTGRFYGYTQFKQEQLLGRLKRCSFQLKQIGAGVAVVAALGMATPAVGQVSVYDLVQRTGVDNPLDTIITTPFLDFFDPIFVDIDADGDLDVFFTNGYSMTFFENTGTVYIPNFEPRTGVANPLDGVVTNGFDFVDIDADGDQDLFTTNDLYAGTNSFNYYKNEGTPTSPNFVLQTVTNPLDSVTYYLNNIGTAPASGLPAFVDIDEDGDMDCFVSVVQYAYSGPTWQSDEKVWYYENQGDSSQANFFKQPKSNNPLYPLMQNLALDAWVTSRPTFFDAEKDGDMDLMLTLTDDKFSGNRTTPFYENIGTSLVPNFDSSSVHPLDSALAPTASYLNIYLVDIDGDTDLDVYSRLSLAPGKRFYENLDTTIVVNLDKIEEKELLSDFLVYPNPSSGILNLETPLTGVVYVLAVDGKEIYSQKIENTQIINLPSIQEGMYMLKIETETEQIIKNIFIEK